MVMLFNAAFNNISVISWKSVLLVEETRVHCFLHVCLLFSNFWSDSKPSNNWYTKEFQPQFMARQSRYTCITVNCTGKL